MAFVRDGYVCKFGHGGDYKRFSGRCTNVFRAIASSSGQYVSIKNVVVPKELFGKRLRFKVEVVDDIFNPDVVNPAVMPVSDVLDLLNSLESEVALHLDRVVYFPMREELESKGVVHSLGFCKEQFKFVVATLFTSQKFKLGGVVK